MVGMGVRCAGSSSAGVARSRSLRRSFPTRAPDSNAICRSTRRPSASTALRRAATPGSRRGRRASRIRPSRGHVAAGSPSANPHPPAGARHGTSARRRASRFPPAGARRSPWGFLLLLPDPPPRGSEALLRVGRPGMAWPWGRCAASENGKPKCWSTHSLYESGANRSMGFESESKSESPSVSGSESELALARSGRDRSRRVVGGVVGTRVGRDPDHRSDAGWHGHAHDLVCRG